jgi:hypothetical protein
MSDDSPPNTATNTSGDEDTLGPFIVWCDYGYDGWGPTSYPTLEAALIGARGGYSSSYVITKPVRAIITETEMTVEELS